MNSNLLNDTARFPLFHKVKQNPEIKAFISEQNLAMEVMGYTEHSFAHVSIVAERTGDILDALGLEDHVIDLALTAAWMHDIGNVVNRDDHCKTGALMSLYLLSQMGVPAEDTAPIMRAIGNHDEETAVPVSEIAAALILADKSDVRRSRVQCDHISKYDIHDRVNYSVISSSLKISPDQQAVNLKLEIDTRYSEIGEYFEIFMDRMLLCRKASEFLKLDFHLIINDQTLL